MALTIAELAQQINDLTIQFNEQTNNSENITALTPKTPIDGTEILPINGDESITSQQIVDRAVAQTTLLDNRIIVKQASDFGVVDSSKEYFLDTIVDMGSTSIEVPSGGINIKGYDFNISGLISSAVGYTMFTSPVGGSGDILWADFKIEVTGTTSKVLDVVSDTGNEAYEIARINFNNCTSLGTVDNYRQGLESGTGRFGGKPELILKGAWSGGYFIDTSIVRALTDGAYSLYKAGTAFVMQSRFRSNQNIDLNATVSFFDFVVGNFPNSSTLQLDGCIVTRNGVSNADDATLIPNINPGDLPSSWTQNNGIPNTFVGGEACVTVEVATVISVAGTFVDLAGTFVANDLQHFDAPASGQLRHLGSSPREYRVTSQFVLDSTANDEIDLKMVMWDDSASSFVDVTTIRRVINNLVGGRNVAYFVLQSNATLDTNDFIKFQVANVGATNNITAELNSFYIVESR